jgi:hypothetical protein
MKALIRSLVVSALAIVTIFSMIGCETASSPPGVVSNSSGMVGGSESGRSGMPWNGPVSGEDNARFSSPPGGATPAPITTHRPGLATVAGRETWAPVQNGWFHRKNSGLPDAVDSFHYNDEAGAKAMMEPLGGGWRHSGMFSTAGDRLKAGLANWEGDLPYLEKGGQRVVMGAAGQTFQIQIKNTTKHRIEAVISVDGLDVLDGQAASVRKNGYVLEAGQEYTIQGFRKNCDNVKQFVFGAVSDSAAAKKGLAHNVGVVGLAVYEEDEAAAKMDQLAEAYKRSGASAFPRN